MALNLSTLTSPATSGDVLAEALTTADFLEPVPVLRNLARGSQKGGDAKQSVSLNQPRALPLIKNPQGNLGGYLYIPDVTGNYATGPSVTIGANQTWEAEVDMVMNQLPASGEYVTPMGGGLWTSGFGVILRAGGTTGVFSKSAAGFSSDIGVVVNTPFNLKYGYDGTNLFVEKDGVRQNVLQTSTQPSITKAVEINQQTNLVHQGNYAIQKAKLTVNNAVVFDCDFNGSTSIRHGDTKFNCVGGPVTINQAGNDPATVIKKSVLRFDGANSGLNGLLNQTVTSGYIFAAFSVLGDGGESFGRIFGLNTTGGYDSSTGGVALRRNGTTNDLMIRYNGLNSPTHNDFFDDERGDYLLEAKVQNGSQQSKVNNADADNGVSGISESLSAEEFSVAVYTNGSNNNAALDLEFLALFPSSITDAQADSVRNYINNRNNVFDLKDGFGYYFFDAQNAPVGNISSGSSSWNGRIVGSDFGDTDRYLTQGTSNDAPVGDGYVVTFADNSDHLDIPSTSQAGWQVVGTSLGTFAYRVNNDAVTELNLLGNAALGDALGFRQAGDLYGIVLLPTSATNAQLNETKKLLTDRGASEQAEGSNYYAVWYIRKDIVEFSAQTFPNATNFGYAWASCISMSDFGAIQAPLGTDFTSTWKDCSALTSFPADAKLGTEANNVSFSSAWRDSGLTSFPALDLSNATNLYRAWRGCNHMVSFGLVDTSSVTNFSDTWLGCTSLTSFPLIDTSSGTNFYRTWYDMDSVTDFPLLNLSAGRYFSESWRFCVGLINFPAGLFDNWNPSSIQTGVFDFTWAGCTSLTAQSVENILTSIDASGHYATTNKVSGGTALGDAGIDIDYNGDTLSAATNAAVTSLKSKGWVIVVNNVTL